MRSIVLISSVLLCACGGGSSQPPVQAPAPVTAVPSSGQAFDEANPVPPPAAEPEVKTAPPARTLYDRLGGQPAITAVVDELVARSTTDPRIKERFFNTDATNLKRLLVEFVCSATGGPCQYTGRSMVASHAGMELVDEEFTALVEALAGALDALQVPEAEKSELLGALGPLKPEVVAKPGTLRPIADTALAKVAKLTSTIKGKPAAVELLGLAVAAGKRGQRSYAEQLFTRAELLIGNKKLAPIAGVFRTGAPPRLQTVLKTLPSDTAAQPVLAGSSELDAPAAKPGGGSLQGMIKIDGKSPNGLGVVMLWPERGKPAKKRAPKQRIVEQRGKTFAPHVTAVPVGSTVSFPNFDSIFHNVFSLSKPKAFDLGMYRNGETREIKLDKPGIVRLGCNLHANMSAYLIVVDAPHYVVVGSDGAYSFKHLAPGRYRVQAWNEQSAEPTTTSLEIKPGANESDIELKPGGPAAIPDKFGGAR